jgi:hypothetical protein
MHALTLFLSLLFVLQAWTKEDSRPPVCYLWSETKVVKGELECRYTYYSNDLDVLRPSAVITSTHKSKVRASL